LQRGKEKAKKSVKLSSDTPKPYQLRRYYLPSEVRAHQQHDDCWVTIFNNVFDITKLLKENKGSELCDPLLLAAGTDISHWFEPTLKEPLTRIGARSGKPEYFCPSGRYLHLPSSEAHSGHQRETAGFDIPWWQDHERYVIGRLTKQVRRIKLMNTLTKDEEEIDVAAEETLNEILDRYLLYNQHAASYTWKRLKKQLRMDQNLDQNGIVDESKECLELGIDPGEYVPVIHLYFDDDLTVI